MSHPIIRAAAFVLLLASVAFAQTTRVGARHDASTASYTITHPFHTFTATSKELRAEAVVDATKRQVTSFHATVDVMTFDSGNSNRDSHAMEVVDAITFPGVSFTSTAIVQHGDTLDVTGDLTFHGVTKSVTATGHVLWGEEALTIEGTFGVSLTDFRVDRPSLLMVPVGDTLRFTVNAAFPLAKKAG